VLRLAADDGPELSFPARYQDDVWTVIIGLGADGEPYCALEAGSGPATVRGEGVEVSLSVGAEAALSDLYTPPLELIVTDAKGVTRTLTGQS